jgi:hypothetical protein
MDKVEHRARLIRFSLRSRVWLRRRFGPEPGRELAKHQRARRFFREHDTGCTERIVGKIGCCRLDGQRFESSNSKHSIYAEYADLSDESGW